MQLPLMITSRDKALKAMQEAELQGLLEIDRICRKHGIKYSLAGGTCLGQVRHGGFIPWDDDIDVDMTEENFNKFMEVAPDEIDKDRFVLYTRDTEDRHYRSAAKLGIKDTRLSLNNWKSVGREVGIFVDIFKLVYLPEDEKQRKKFSRDLYLIRSMQHYKEVNRVPANIEPKYKFLVKRLAPRLSPEYLQKREDKLIHSVKGRTSWIVDDAVIHGDIGGLPSEGTDECKDVEFEGHTVMSRKDPHNYLCGMYGPNYGEWLPPAKRISHHKWIVFDLGPYAAKYGLDDSYKEFMTISFTPEKLKQMKIVSDMMVDKVLEICKKHDINCSVARVHDTGINPDIPELKDMWIRPAAVMMLRKDYDKFASICQEEFGNQYFYQTHATDPNCYFDYARLRLNYTMLRDRHLQYNIDYSMHIGFFIRILPLDNCMDDPFKDENLRDYRFWKRFLWVKWGTTDLDSFSHRKFRDKVKLTLYKKYSLDDAYNNVVKYAQFYNDQECTRCFDSSRQLGGAVLNIEDVRNNDFTDIEASSLQAETVEDVLALVERRFGACHLTYYDIPDHQLSILRYDEKEDRLLSNEEIFGQV